MENPHLFKINSILAAFDTIVTSPAGKTIPHTFDFRPLGLAIREARERAGLSRNDLGDKVFYGERHIADIENVGSHPSFQLFHDLVTMFNISVDEYFYPAEKVAKSTARRQIETALDLLSDNELKIIQGTIDGILNSRENKK